MMWAVYKGSFTKNQKKILALILCAQSLYSILEVLLILDYITFSFPACFNSNFENLRKNALRRDSKDKERLRPLGKI